MNRLDDRTQEEKKTHNYLVTATDTFLSGWGDASCGLSKVAWACESKDVGNVLKWVEGRSDTRNVRVITGKWYPRNAVHVQIYVVHENHRYSQSMADAILAEENKGGN